MLRKIDCVMIRVDRLEVAGAYYRDVFGLRPNWSDDVSSGFKFPESDTEIVLHNDPNIPSSVEVYYPRYDKGLSSFKSRRPLIEADAS